MKGVNGKKEKKQREAKFHRDKEIDIVGMRANSCDLLTHTLPGLIKLPGLELYNVYLAPIIVVCIFGQSKMLLGVFVNAKSDII